MPESSVSAFSCCLKLCPGKSKGKELDSGFRRNDEHLGNDEQLGTTSDC